MYKKFIYQILFIMRLTTIILILGMMQVSAIGFAQKITYSQKDVTLAKVFKEIRKQTGYIVLWSARKVKSSTTIDVNFKEASLKEVLEKCLENQPLTYEIDEKTIIIKEKSPSVIDKIINYFSILDVRGKVLDENGEPLQGATVKVKGTAQGVMTDKEGEFFLKGVSGEAVIIIAYLGYKPLELKATPSMGLIKMEPATSELNEVTVSTGYWTTTKSLSTGNISKVTAKEIGNQPVTSPLMALQGRVPGLDINPNNGAAPGGAPRIRIRGENSLGSKIGFGGGYPLYVVDGVVIDSKAIESVASNFYSGSNQKGGIDPLVNIDPENIESIEILKDGESTSIYGSRGANGVILITTKKSAPQKGAIDVNVYRGIGQVASKLKLLNTEQYLQMRNEALKNDGLAPGPLDYDINGTWDITRYTNWQKELIGENAGITNVMFNYSMGGEQTHFRLGGGYHSEGTVFPGDFGEKRLTGNFSLNHSSPNKKLNISLTANYGITRHNMFNSNLTRWVWLAPNAPSIYQSDGSLNWQIVDLGGGNLRESFQNPLAGLLKTYTSSTDNLTTSGSLSYNINSHFNAKINLGYTNTRNEETYLQPIAALSPLLSTSTSSSSTFGLNSRPSWIIEPQVNYSNLFGKHSIGIVIGSSFQENSTQRKLVIGSGYTSDELLNTLKGAGSVKAVEDLRAQYRYSGMFGRVGYNYQEKYVLNVTGRRDGSSRFSPGRQFGNFGAIGGGWIFSKENFISQTLSFLSFGKIRGSFGITGSDQVGDYQFYDLYKIGNLQYNGQIVLEPASLFNDNYRWERTTKLEAGVELGLFSGTLNLEAAWYRNRTSNQLVFYQLPEVTGFTSVLSNFPATVQNSGGEFLLSSRNISTNKFHWSTTLNLTIPRNELTAFPGIEESVYKDVYQVGQSLSIEKRYRWGGVDPASGKHQIIDVNGDGIINANDRVFMLPTDRKYFGGLLNTLRVGAFELSVLLQFSEQKKRDADRFLPGEIFAGNQSVEVLNRWQKPGDHTDYARYGTTAADAELYATYVGNSDYKIRDIRLLRLKTTSITYSISPPLLKKIKVTKASLYLQGQNLFTFSNFSGLDPESDASGDYPQLRMVTGGIQLKF